MLSARAGEEASVEGLQAGADDYLVKPFSSRELLARVSTHLQLHRSREHLDLALKGADLAAWDWNVQTGEFIHNARWAELRGYASDELPQRVESLFDAVHPDDLPRVQQALRDHFDGHRSEYAAELRVATKDGRWVWIVQRGKVFARDEHGQPLRMAGTALDITRRKRTEMEQQFLAEVGPSLHKSLVVEDTLSALADMVVKHLADYCVIDLVEDSGEIRRAKVACSLGQEAGARRGVRALAARKPAYADPPAGPRGRDEAAVRDRRAGGPGGVGPERGAPPAAAARPRSARSCGCPCWDGTGSWVASASLQPRPPGNTVRTICSSPRSSPAVPRSPSTTHAFTARPNEPSPPATRCSQSSLTICAIRSGSS